MSIVLKTTPAYIGQTVYRYYGFLGAARSGVTTGWLTRETYAPVDPSQQGLWEELLDPNSTIPSIDRNMGQPVSQDDLWVNINRSIQSPYYNQDTVSWGPDPSLTVIPVPVVPDPAPVVSTLSVQVTETVSTPSVFAKSFSTKSLRTSLGASSFIESAPVTATPEPGAWILVGTGLILLALWKKARRACGG